MIKILFFIFMFINLSFADVYELNREHSKVKFTVDYMSLSKVEGIFKDFTSSFEFNPKTNKLKKIEAKIEAKSVDTSDPKRDNHLRGMEFLFSSKYPEISFTSEQEITVVPKKKTKLNGVLEIRGIKQNIVGDLIYKGKVLDPWGKENLFLEFSTEIDRKKFNMVWNKELDEGGLLVGDNVGIQIIIQAQLKGEKTSFSTHMIPSTKGIVERDQLKKGKIKKLSTSTEIKN